MTISAEEIRRRAEEIREQIRADRRISAPDPGDWNRPAADKRVH